MLLEAGKVVVVCDVPDANYQAVILQLVMMVITPVRNLDHLFLEVNAFHVTLKELYMFKKLADGIDDVRHVQVAGRDFVKHGREEKKVVVVHECNLDVRISSDRPFQLKSGVQTPKAAAENDNPFAHNSATSQKILIAPLAFKSLSKSSL